MSHRTNPLSQSKRERFRQQVLALHGPTCRMPVCLMPTRRIDLTLTNPVAPGYYTADHIIEIDNGGAPYDITNGRPAHRRCNVSAGAASGNRTRRKPPTRTTPLRTSRPW